MAERLFARLSTLYSTPWCYQSNLFHCSLKHITIFSFTICELPWAHKIDKKLSLSPSLAHSQVFIMENLIMLDRAWQNNYTNLIVICYPFAMQKSSIEVNKNSPYIYCRARDDDFFGLREQTSVHIYIKKSRVNRPSSSILSKQESQKKQHTERAKKLKLNQFKRLFLLRKLKYLLFINYRSAPHNLPKKRRKY